MVINAIYGKKWCQVPIEQVIPWKGKLKWDKELPEHKKLHSKFWWKDNEDAEILFLQRIRRFSHYRKDFYKNFLLEEKVDQE